MRQFPSIALVLFRLSFSVNLASPLLFFPPLSLFSFNITSFNFPQLPLPFLTYRLSFILTTPVNNRHLFLSPDQYRRSYQIGISAVLICHHPSSTRNRRHANLPYSILNFVLFQLEKAAGIGLEDTSKVSRLLIQRGWVCTVGKRILGAGISAYCCWFGKTY